MTRRITDLAQALSKEPAGTGIGLAKATIQSWDSTTFENRLEYYGTVLEDVPVMSGTDALTYQAGDEVTLLTYHPVDGHRHRGLGSYWILGRVVRPGAENAARVIQFLQSELAKTIVDEIVEELLVSPAGQELAAFVFGQRMHAASDTASVSQSSTSYGTLTGGPVVADVDISDSGRAIVMVGATIRCQVASGSDSDGGYMSFAVSGATTVAADDHNAMRTTLTNHIADGPNQSLNVRAHSAILVTGLNPGSHTFTAQYRAFSGSNPVDFSSRTLVVMAF